VYKFTRGAVEGRCFVEIEEGGGIGGEEERERAGVDEFEFEVEVGSKNGEIKTIGSGRFGSKEGIRGCGHRSRSGGGRGESQKVEEGL